MPFKLKVIFIAAVLVGIGYGFNLALPYLANVPRSIWAVSGATCVAWSALRLLQWAANR